MKNTKFKSLTPAEKRVAIAKDVIQQVLARRYKLQNMTYVDTDDESQIINKEILTSKKPPICTVCAKGALVCSTVRLFNKFSGDSDDLFSQVEPVLRRNFGRSNGDMIEVAFEKWTLWEYGNEKSRQGACLSESQANKARSFGCKHRSMRKRVIAIMKNIIANNGEFKP